MIPDILPPPGEPPDRTRVRAIAFAVMVLLVAVVSIVWYSKSRGGNTTTSSLAEQIQELDPDARAPEGIRIRVIVLNGTDTRGRARRATNLVRDLGYDVVEYGNAPEKQDSTTVLVHTGNMDWGRRLARGVNARVIERPDTSRYTDLTLLIGSDWKPPAQPFRP